MNKYEKISARKCPKCDSLLIETFALNPEIFGIKNNARDLVCRNRKCKAWLCDYCQEWHPYGTTCSVAMVKNSRTDKEFWTSYEEWIEKEEAWERNYNPSKRNNTKKFLLSASEISVSKTAIKQRRNFKLSPSSKEMVGLIMDENKRRKKHSVSHQPVESFHG